MSTLYTVAYPQIDAADRAFIERFRDEHDARNRSVIAAHFTLVFGCGDIPEAGYCPHVAGIAASHSTIAFCCRYAMLGADDGGDTACVFLVPDEGHSQLSLLHDALYTGILEPHLRLDLPYTPHITVGSLLPRHQAKRLCDALNSRGIVVRGTVSALHVGGVQNGKFESVGHYPLRA